jgi:hypothetical protein
MLDKIVEICIASSSSKIEGSLLLCKYTVADIPFVQKLYDDSFIENTFTSSIKDGDEVELEFSLPRLTTIGFYKDWSAFIKQNYYEYPNHDCYSFENKSYLKNDSEFNNKYRAVIELAESILQISKHSYEEEERRNAIVLREDITLFLPLLYKFKDFKSLEDNTIVQIIEVTKLFSDDKVVDKKSIFINTLIDQLLSEKEEKRFSTLIRQFKNYHDKAVISYNFFLKDFSFNKLKLEIDTKALDFNQKLQGVINDTQGKLIAIPTAFVLVLTTFNFDKADLKNWAILLSTIIFTFFIQIFLQNQKSSLKFIKDNIEYYKQTFTEDLIKISDRFSHLENEYINQKRRIDLLQFLLWLVPIGTTSIFCYVYGYNSSWIIAVLYCVAYLIFYFVEYYTQPIKK